MYGTPRRQVLACSADDLECTLTMTPCRSNLLDTMFVLPMTCQIPFEPASFWDEPHTRARRPNSTYALSLTIGLLPVGH